MDRCYMQWGLQPIRGEHQDWLAVIQTVSSHWVKVPACMSHIWHIFGRGGRGPHDMKERGHSDPKTLHFTKIKAFVPHLLSQSAGHCSHNKSLLWFFQSAHSEWDGDVNQIVPVTKIKACSDLKLYLDIGGFFFSKLNFSGLFYQLEHHCCQNKSLLSSKIIVGTALSKINSFPHSKNQPLLIFMTSVLQLCLLFSTLFLLSLYWIKVLQ